MKTCLCCHAVHDDDTAATCLFCGEGSWSASAEAPKAKADEPPPAKPEEAPKADEEESSDDDTTTEAPAAAAPQRPSRRR